MAGAQSCISTCPYTYIHTHTLLSVWAPSTTFKILGRGEPRVPVPPQRTWYSADVAVHVGGWDTLGTWGPSHLPWPLFRQSLTYLRPASLFHRGLGSPGWLCGQGRDEPLAHPQPPGAHPGALCAPSGCSGCIGPPPGTDSQRSTIACPLVSPGGREGGRTTSGDIAESLPLPGLALLLLRLLAPGGPQRSWRRAQHQGWVRCQHPLGDQNC